MNPEELALLALLDEQEAQTAALTTLLLDRFDGLTSWRDADAADFAAEVAPIVEAAQADMATLAAVSMADQIAAATEDTLELLGVRPSTAVDLRHGVTTEDVYQRPFRQVWKDLHEGRTLTDSVASGRRRLEHTARTDLQLAKRQGAHSYLTTARSGGRVVGYRRVLTGLENCGLCIVASSQRYHVEDLMPIHNNCDCAIAPIIGNTDPGQVINTMMVTSESRQIGTTRHGDVFDDQGLRDLGNLLEPAHDAIAETFGAAFRDARELDYRKVILEIDHDELGPVIDVKRHKLK